MLHHHFMVFHFDGDYPRSQYELMCTWRDIECLEPWCFQGRLGGEILKKSMGFKRFNGPLCSMYGIFTYIYPKNGPVL